MIYFLRPKGETTPVKIGYTDQDPHKRRSNLQTGSHVELELWYYYDGDVSEERSLHDTFAEYRLRGEWFDCSDEIESFVESMSKLQPAVIRPAVEYNNWNGKVTGQSRQQAIIAVRQRAVAVNVPIYMVCERADIAPSTLTRWRTQPDKAQWAKINRLAEAMTEIEQEKSA